jgi:hypothetical protein
MVLDCHGLAPQLSKRATHSGRDYLWPTARAERFDHPHESGRIVGFSGRDGCSHGLLLRGARVVPRPARGADGFEQLQHATDECRRSRFDNTTSICRSSMKSPPMRAHGRAHRNCPWANDLRRPLTGRHNSASTSESGTLIQLSLRGASGHDAGPQLDCSRARRQATGVPRLRGTRVRVADAHPPPHGSSSPRRHRGRRTAQRLTNASVG